MPSFSLGTRLALVILLGTIATVGSVLLVAYNALVEDFETLLTQQQLAETRRISAEVDQRLQLKLDVLAESASLLNDGKTLHSLSEISAQLNRQALLQSLFPDGILVLDEHATAIYESFHVPGRLGTNYADRRHFRRALQTREPVISRPIIGRTTGVPLLSFLAPIESDEGDLLGFIAGTIKVGQTSLIPPGLLRSIRDSDASFKVVDMDNFLFIEGGPSDQRDIESLPPPGQDPLIDAALSGTGFGRVIDNNGHELIFAASHLQRLGWLFVRAVPYERASAPAKKSFSRFLGISLGIGLMIALLSFIASRSITRPLDRMTRAIKSMVRKPEKAVRLSLNGPREVQNLASAFNRLMDERDAMSEMKEHFVSNVSHELRTPLTSINGALRLLESGAAGELPEKAQQMSTLALRNGERLQMLISDLLDFSKLTAGQMSVSLRTQALDPIIEAAIASNQSMASEYQVRLEKHEDSNFQIVADNHRLRQVLDNYISNAIKFSPAEQCVRVTAEEADHDFVRIVVSDRGDGVPKNFIPKLFERFSQAEEGTTRSVKGTGLGLAICAELAQLMHGRVGYYFDRGAHFWIEIPRDGKPRGEP
ncbi:hypothetical protein D777_02860 [Marinobacter nitratireducens]|uniref:histidine kinase n=1 Tax=Marinobacter nitratireducens TaxID=1137280 RepID=A0A072N1S3_9GAMM|nr:sensor histidine kinase [Marinobacter nitratireducens]KEF30918.1 hypothetical protein D777_02860 [Marinobacter nitratireducens]